MPIFFPSNMIIGRKIRSRKRGGKYKSITPRFIKSKPIKPKKLKMGSMFLRYGKTGKI